ncbi:purine-nucleoside phosphorylase [Candidatus Avelusimicrobium caledoniensis]|uniref:purine-nucleoside phosphorylase n=1 Tax=Candidatus Avelusimicrobium caledoniensis TaxID=3416220 RepID=UPI003D0EF5AC
MPQLAQIKKAVSFINKKTKNFKPQIGLIAGSGLGWAIPPLEKKVIVPYTTIPGFLQSTVPGHAGNLIFGEYKGTKIVVMQGRFHFYEGYQMKEFAISVRTLKMLGVEKLLVSGAVGSMDKQLPPGSLCVLKDHINFMCNNPLIGNSREPEFGPMFFDLSEAYDKTMRKVTLAACKKIGLKAKEGVYIAVTGPNFETPSEIQMFKKWGASVVGMSVVPEVLVARQCGIKVLGLAVVTNMGCGIEKKPLSHEQTIRESKKAEINFKKLMEILFVKL